jgi:flavin-binding protein dodecin
MQLSAKQEETAPMNDHVYKVIEIVGSSTESSDHAIENAIERAAKTVDNLDWFEVRETRGHIVDGKIAHYQVKLGIGFRLE